MDRRLSPEQITEIESGDGYYYVSQGMAGFAGEWPAVVKHPKNKMLRLVRRQAPKIEELTISSFAQQDAYALEFCRHARVTRMLRPSTIRRCMEDSYGRGPADKALPQVFTKEEIESDRYENNVG